MSSPTEIVITPEALLEHWQGHRRVTRRLIDAFPEDKLFSFSVGGMRPFSELVMEFLGMSVPTLKGVIAKDWSGKAPAPPKTKAELLALWDADTEQINRLWPTIPPGRFQERDVAFGQWEMPIHGLLWYIIDNEIHHRGQGYAYLRALGIEPPPFYDRS
jgi:uncharacterized damage-inducible protein DinB